MPPRWPARCDLEHPYPTGMRANSAHDLVEPNPVRRLGVAGVWQHGRVRLPTGVRGHGAPRVLCVWTYLAPEHTVLLTTPNGSKLSEPDKSKRTVWSTTRLKWSTVTRAHAPRQVAYTCGQGGAFETADACAAVTCDGSYLRPATGHDPLERSVQH